MKMPRSIVLILLLSVLNQNFSQDKAAAKPDRQEDSFLSNPRSVYLYGMAWGTAIIIATPTATKSPIPYYVLSGFIFLFGPVLAGDFSPKAYLYVTLFAAALAGMGLINQYALTQEDSYGKWAAVNAAMNLPFWGVITYLGWREIPEKKGSSKPQSENISYLGFTTRF